MNKFWKNFCITVVSLLVVIDLAFVFVLPRCVDINKYKTDIQNIVKEQAKMTLDFDNAQLITTPLFGVGAKIDNISIKLPDNSILFSADSIKTRVALPSLFLLTVKVSCFEIDKLFLNLEIAKDNNDFKIVDIIEDILNTPNEEALAKAKQPEEEKSFFNPAWIRIKVPNVKLTNYKVLISDINTKHFLNLQGEELHLGYLNGKSASIKTYAELFSDENKNITANIDINTFLPPPAPALDEEDDPAERIDIPFINPVEMYRKYDLKADIDTKLYIRSYGKNDISSFGHFNIDNLNLKVMDIQLPSSYIHAKTFKNNVWVDTDINVKEKQNIKLLGRIKYGARSNMDLNINTGEIYFNDLIILSKAFLDSFSIKNELGQYSAKGYLKANSYIKTNFKKLKSFGSINIVNGSLAIRNLGEIISKANVNLLLDNNILNIENSSLFLHNAKVLFNGKIDEKSVADISISTENINLPPLFNAFAPRNLRDEFAFNSGDLKVDLTLEGKLKNAIANANIKLNNLNFADRKNTFKILNKQLCFNILLDAKSLLAKLNNEGFTFFLPQTNSQISAPSLLLDISDKNISIAENQIILNNKTVINYRGVIEDYEKLKNIDISADGNLNTKNLVAFIGNEFAPFVNYKGNIPFKFGVLGDKDKQTLSAQIFANANNYITPVNFKELIGKDVILQAIVDFKPSRIKIKKTGFFEKVVTVNEDGKEVEELKDILEIDGTIAGDTINLIKVTTPNALNGNIFVFPKSKLTLNKNKLYIYGKMAEPRVHGALNINNLSIPELLTSLDNLDVKFAGDKLDFIVNNLLLNGSDILAKGKVSLLPASVINVSDVNVKSNLLNVDKMMHILTLLEKYMPKTVSTSAVAASAPADIPVTIKNGNIDLREIRTGNIKIYNVLSDIRLAKNVFYLDDLTANAFSGKVDGDISANLITMLLNIDMKGSKINVEQALYDAANMKDTLFGKVDFDADLSLKGVTYEEQVKTLKGKVDFVVKDGSFGPFARLENMILAENIRESQFFQTALGGVINSLATVDTTHFAELKGNVHFEEDGICYLDKITSSGDILALHIFGGFDILKNTADMKVRAKMTSIISDLLGPLAMVNPVNLINSAASLNVFTAKAFSLFTETLTDEEMSIIPNFATTYSDNTAMKFQIVVRGDVAKPLTLVKSFKWLATQMEFAKAQEFAESIPSPLEGSTATTINEVIQEIQAFEKEKETLKYKVKHIFDQKDEEIKQNLIDNKLVNPELLQNEQVDKEAVKENIKENLKNQMKQKLQQSIEQKIQQTLEEKLSQPTKEVIQNTNN